MPFYEAGHIAGFLVIVQRRDRIWGPFDSPDQAAKWAIDTITGEDEWIIKPMLDPEYEKH